MNRLALGLLAAVTSTSFVAPAFAEDFYAGKTVSIVVGAGAGGFDMHARVMAKHMPRFIPGNPTMIVQNMPGAGGIQAANYVYAIAEKDGTVIGNVTQNLQVEEAVGTEGVAYKTAEFGWIGRTTSSTVVTITAAEAPVKTFEDALANKVVLGTTGVVSSVYLYPKLSNDVLGAKFELVPGYKDTASMLFALERGEIQGTTLSWDSLKGLRPDWLEQKTVNIPVQFAAKRNPELADVPTVVEFAKNPEDKAVLDLFMSASEIGRAFFVPPGVPSERIEILRKAFADMVKDPEFQADMKTAKLDFDPMNGAELEQLVRQQASYPAAIIDRAKELRKAN